MPRQSRRSRRTRVRYDSPDDCCTSCCITCCCCCCWSRTMVPRKSRIKMLWMYLLIIGLAIGITIGVVFYGGMFTDFSASDMKVIDGKLSHLFCDSVNIDTANPTSDFAPFSAYIVETPLKIDPNNKEMYGFQMNFDFNQPWTYATRQFYLLSDSSAKLYCPQVSGNMDIVIIKGHANYTEFIKDSPKYQCVGCEYAHITYTIRHSGPNSWTFSDTDEYFFVFIGQESLWAECELDLTKTVYKTDISTSSCYKVTTCEFSLDLKESDPPKQIIVKLEPDKASSGKRYMYSNTSIQSTCVARLWIYIVLFLCCPGMVCIFFSVLIYKCCSDPEDEDDDDISDEHSPLLWDSAPSYSGVVVTEPPKYEDIMADNDNRLPSYEEAVASGTFPAGNYGAVGNVGINHPEPLRNTDVTVNQSNILGHVNIIDVGATNNVPNRGANENTTDNTNPQGQNSLNFTDVSGSVNLDQTSRVLVMNLSSDIQTSDLVSPINDLEPSSSDFDSDSSSDSADSVAPDNHSEQVRNCDMGRTEAEQ